MIYAAVSVRPSRVGGQGLFLEESINKGQKILAFDGPIIDWDEAVCRGREDHVVPIGENAYVDIGEQESLVNHSCDPTAGFAGDTTLIALRDLAKGDEVTFDYSLVTADGWTMECKCGSKECRHTISDYADLSPAVKEKYKGVTPAWMLAGRYLVIPEGLFVADPANFQDKVARFAVAGAGGMHAVFDFDRTLTVKKPGTQAEVTTWHILREHLPEDAQVEYQRLFEKYRALELSGDMTQQDAATWWSSTLNLFVEHKIDLTAVEETFLDRASIRPGTTELFKLFADNGIPTIILSAGVREVIDIWCRKYDIQPTLVVSTSLMLDDQNRVSGWQENTLIHILNKSESTHPELLSIRTQRPKALVVGDSLDDASMAVGEQDVIRVRILDPRADEGTAQQEERKTFEKFDALIKTGSLSPLEKMIEHVI